jgi:hypothetical protein
MNDVDAANKVLAQLTDQRDRATDRVRQIEDQRRSLAYAVHADGNEKQQAGLNALNRQMADLASMIEDVDLALAEGRRRLDAAKAAAGRADASEHRQRARAILAELEACAPELDRTIPHPDDGQPYAFSDPPTVCKTAALAHALLVELKAVGLGRDATFPKSWHGAAGKFDLEKALRGTASAGWPGLSADIRPATRNSISFGVRQTVNFTRLLGVWANAVRADLARHEQATNKAEIAA